MLAHTVPVRKNTCFACTQPGNTSFLKCLHAIHECSVHAPVSLSTRYAPASTINMEVTRIHAGKKSNTYEYVHLSVLSPYGIPEALITTALVYLFTKTIIMCFTSQFAIFEKVTSHTYVMGPFTRINKCFTEF